MQKFLGGLYYTMMVFSVDLLLAAHGITSKFKYQLSPIIALAISSLISEINKCLIIKLFLRNKY